MNVVNKLTLRHMKLNKKRTIVTIIGVIISVTMLTAVATFFSSFQDLMIRDNIRMYGEWHIAYNNVPVEKSNIILDDKNTEFTILSNNLGVAKIKNPQNKKKPYFSVTAQNNFEKSRLKLTEGHFPKNSNEIVISEQIIKDGNDYKVGDTISLDVTKKAAQDKTKVSETNNDNNQVANKTKIYNITGIVKKTNSENSWDVSYPIYTYLDQKQMDSIKTVTAKVALKDINKEIFDHSEEIVNKIDSEGIITDSNSKLLILYGVTGNKTFSHGLIVTLGILFAIIMIGSISLIYNAFAISVSERSRQLGMLASVGATKKQKRHSVFFEGFIVGIISIPLGILFSVLGLAITFSVINPMLKNILSMPIGLKVVIMPWSIIVSVVFSILTIAISTFIPARRASTITPIDAIRQTNDIKLKSKNVKTSKLTRWLFGFEGELALKNLKRNRKKYKATIFSLIISILLFLTVNSYLSYMTASYDLYQSRDLINYDVCVTLDNEYEEKSTELFNKIGNINDIDNISFQKKIYVSTLIDKKYANNLLLKELNNTNLPDNKVNYQLSINSLDKKSFEKYTKKIGATYNEFLDTANPKAIIVNKSIIIRNSRFNQIESIKAKENNTIEFEPQDKTKNTNPFKLTIANITEEIPIGKDYSNNPNELQIFVSEEVFDSLISYSSDTFSTIFLTTNGDADVLEKDIFSVIEKETGLKADVFNLSKHMKQQRQVQLIIQIFVYGFIILITLICIANISNTISTSIGLRKREFAMLKSVGMTPKSFSKMIRFESIFYGIKSLLYGLPISFAIMVMMYRSMSGTTNIPFTVPWASVIISIVGVFLIVGITMLYSTSKIKKDNIIDTLRQTNT